MPATIRLSLYCLLKHARKAWKTMLLRTVSYGCETWPLTLWEEKD
jgi:hypothetical protein